MHDLCVGRGKEGRVGGDGALQWNHEHGVLVVPRTPSPQEQLSLAYSPQSRSFVDGLLVAAYPEDHRRFKNNGNYRDPATTCTRRTRPRMDLRRHDIRCCSSPVMICSSRDADVGFSHREFCILRFVAVLLMMYGAVVLPVRRCSRSGFGKPRPAMPRRPVVVILGELNVFVS